MEMGIPELVPPENLQPFQLIYMIENGLRELIIAELHKLDGPRWYKHRLPADVLQKYRDAIQVQRHIKWTSLIPHHSLYYIDFADLRKILEREDNWNDAFGRLFSRKDIISSTLSEIEFVRNSIAHNRRITLPDHKSVTTAYNKLVAAVGRERFCHLASTVSSAHEIRQDIELLRKEATLALETCKKCAVLGELSTWHSTQAQWWFDESYLGHDLRDIEACFNTFREYSSLPRSRGSGHIIENWVSSNQLEEKFHLACLALTDLLESA